MAVLPLLRKAQQRFIFIMRYYGARQGEALSFARGDDPIRGRKTGIKRDQKIEPQSHWPGNEIPRRQNTNGDR